MPDLLPPQQIGEARLERRRKLRDIVDGTVKNFEASDDAKLMDSNFEAAFRMMTSTQARGRLRPDEGAAEGPRALRHEPLRPVLPAGAAADRGGRAVRHGQHVPHRVRRDHLGHPRLRAVHVDRRHEEHRRPMYDQGYSALIEDLAERGMLDNTLVCNLAEFGRTPRVNPAGGRDHWPQCWTVYFAGGGVKGGRVVGRSDRSAAFRPSGRSSRRRSSPRSTTASASISKRSCPARRAARSRSSISARTRSRNCSERNGDWTSGEWGMAFRQRRFSMNVVRLACALTFACIASLAHGAELAILPSDITLAGPTARQTLLVERVDAGQFVGEVPLAATEWEVSDPKIVVLTTACWTIGQRRSDAHRQER